MTRSSDLVMVEREVLESIRAAILEAPADVLTDTLWIPERFSFNETVVDCIDAALQSVEGGVQGSIATKQATDETAASVLSEALDDVSSVYDEMCIQFSGVHADDRMDSLMLRLHSALKAFGREQVGTICAHEDGCPPFGGPCPSCEPRYQYSALAQLTKTPSADHDAGNLRGLAVQGSIADGQQCNEHRPQALSRDSRLADDLERLCCAETEGQFFSYVADNIQTIIKNLRASEAMTFIRAMDIAEAGFAMWKAKPHNVKWFKHIDGTPIPNDLLVNIAEAFCNEA